LATSLFSFVPNWKGAGDVGALYLRDETKSESVVYRANVAVEFKSDRVKTKQH